MPPGAPGTAPTQPRSTPAAVFAAYHGAESCQHDFSRESPHQSRLTRRAEALRGRRIPQLSRDARPCSPAPPFAPHGRNQFSELRVRDRPAKATRGANVGTSSDMRHGFAWPVSPIIGHGNSSTARKQVALSRGTGPWMVEEIRHRAARERSLRRHPGPQLARPLRTGPRPGRLRQVRHRPTAPTPAAKISSPRMLRTRAANLNAAGIREGFLPPLYG